MYLLVLMKMIVIKVILVKQPLQKNPNTFQLYDNWLNISTCYCSVMSMCLNLDIAHAILQKNVGFILYLCIVLVAQNLF